MDDRIPRQDRNGVRTPVDLQRRYRFDKTKETVEETSEIVSSIDVQLDSKVDKVAGKGLSTNDFSNTYKQNVDSNTSVRHTHTNKTILDGITQEKINNWDSTEESSHTHDNKAILDEITQTKVNDWDSAKASTDATSYDLSAYKVSDLTILRSSCIKKNNRVAINFVGTLSMAANITTTLFNLPADLQPSATKDFVLFGSTNNNDGYIGYGYITNTGLTQVRFSQAITSYMRFSLVYDLD